MESKIKKKVEVIMLPTNQKSNLYINSKKELCYSKHEVFLGISSYFIHLYFVDDSPIKEGDWCINKNRDTLYQMTSEDGMNAANLYWDKVITTTDRSLKFKNDCDCGAATFEGCSQCLYILPQPSDSFIAKYIESYNQGNPIKYVMIDYQQMIHHKGELIDKSYPEGFFEPTIKVDKNNRITITRCKESWNREEIMKFMDDWYDKDIFDSYLNELLDKNLSSEQLSFSKSDTGKKFIEQNL